MADTFFLGDDSGSWIMTDPPELSSTGTETSGSDSTDGSSTPTQSQTTNNNVEDLDALLAAASDLRLATTSRIASLLGHLAGHISSLQEHHEIYHDQTGPHSRARNPSDLRMMVYHSQKRLEVQAQIQETLGQGSQLINKVLVLLGEKAELVGVEIDSDEMRQWLDDWAGFGLELDQFQRLLDEAIMEHP
ncbi:hypothetical protein KCV07_g1548, partial [Aureobasidium melanogenum]